MRIAVRRVLELLASYPDRAALAREYPFLEPEDLTKCCGIQPQALMTRV
jgi:uncharacterized protein (DUF433 family)